MTKRIALGVVIFILSLSAPVLAAEDGVIEGLLVNGTEGGSSSVADQDITLKTYLDNTEVASTAAKTDADGYFIFDGLETELGYIYQITLTFQQADYYSEGLSFAEGETTKSTEVVVYDSTTSDAAIKVTMSHTVIYVEQGSLWVEKYFLFVNTDNRTYIGSKEAPTPGGRETLRFSLPKGATELQYVRGLMGCCIIDSEDGFIDTMPVLPGGKEVVYSYRVDYNSGAYTFSQGVNYPTTNFALLVQGEDIEVASDQLTVEEPMVVEDIWWNHLSGQELASGNILDIRLSGLPQATNQASIMWVVLAVVILGAASGFIYLKRKGRLQPVSHEDDFAQRRQRLLVELAQLDDDFEAGKIQEESYHRLRSVKKAQLIELTQGPKDKSGSG